jgi:hypothetical protein
VVAKHSGAVAKHSGAVASHSALVAWPANETVLKTLSTQK